MFPYFIAKRYLFSKKSHHAINIISGVAVCGIAIATAALICILSVFNGFQDMVAGLFTSFDPELKVVSAQSKYMAADEKELEALKQLEIIDVYSETIEDNALVVVNNRQRMVTVKGVSDNFTELSSINDLLLGDGVFELSADVIDYGIFGSSLLTQLGVRADVNAPFELYAPRKGEKLDITNPLENLNNEQIFSPKVSFMVKQSKYDGNYVITSLPLARRLFDRQGYVTAVELKVSENVSVSEAKSKIEKLIGDKYKVLDRYEQQEDTFKVMKIEKLISYIFLTFILLIACFNIIGSLTMLIIDKKNDIYTLRCLGATERQLESIFLLEGRIVALVGAVAGIVLGVTLCLLQLQFGLIRFGNGDGAYIIDTYPVSIKITDIVLVFVTVLSVGFLSIWYPCVRAVKGLKKEK